MIKKFIFHATSTDLSILCMRLSSFIGPSYSQLFKDRHDGPVICTLQNNAVLIFVIGWGDLNRNTITQYEAQEEKINADKVFDYESLPQCSYRYKCKCTRRKTSWHRLKHCDK